MFAGHILSFNFNFLPWVGEKKKKKKEWSVFGIMWYTSIIWRFYLVLFFQNIYFTRNTNYAVDIVKAVDISDCILDPHTQFFKSVLKRQEFLIGFLFLYEAKHWMTIPDVIFYIKHQTKLFNAHLLDKSQEVSEAFYVLKNSIFFVIFLISDTFCSFWTCFKPASEVVKILHSKNERVLWLIFVTQALFYVETISLLLWSYWNFIYRSFAVTEGKGGGDKST